MNYLQAFFLYIKNFLDQLFSFVRAAYSDNGQPSSSRILTFILAIVSSKILLKIAVHVIAITDPVALASWLGALPLLISALVLFFTAPYGVNVGSGTVSDLINTLKGKNQP